MVDDLDDLIDDVYGNDEPVVKSKIDSKKGFGLDDLEDDDNFEWAGPTSSKPKTNNVGFGARSNSSKPPMTQKDDDSSSVLFGFGANKGAGTSGNNSRFGFGGANTSSQGKLNNSFGGASNKGSAVGSRKSKAEQEADAFGELLDDIV